MNVGQRAEETPGLELRSDFIDAGPVPHRGIAYDKQKRVVAKGGNRAARRRAPPHHSARETRNRPLPRAGRLNVAR